MNTQSILGGITSLAIALSFTTPVFAQAARQGAPVLARPSGIVRTEFTCTGWVNRISAFQDQVNNRREKKVAKYDAATLRLNEYANKYLSDPNAGDEAQALLDSGEELTTKIDTLKASYAVVVSLASSALSQAQACENGQVGADEFKATIESTKAQIEDAKESAFGEIGVRDTWTNTVKPAAIALMQAL
ncbi:MAG: hypothetical protein Q7S76_00185 [bacterium]|nr:hypothetical protein [bacterium]